MLAQLEQDFPQDVRVVYRHYPLISIHDKASLSAQAAEAAGVQGKFWEMHDLLLGLQSEWSGLSVAQFQTWLETQAGSLGLDVEKFASDLTSTAVVNKVKAAYDSATQLQIPGTPFLVVNGKSWDQNLPMSYANLVAIVNMLKLSDRQFKTCPPMTIDQKKTYVATIRTEKGDIVLKLFPDKAPLAVNSFVFLAQQGWFDNITFHRVIPGFMAQAGDPSASGFGTPGYAFSNEIADLKFDKPGVVGMANAGPDSNGSQFFITYDAASHLDGKYTIFGEVVSGMDVLQKLTPRDPSQGGNLPPGDTIITITIEEK